MLIVVLTYYLLMCFCYKKNHIWQPTQVSLLLCFKLNLKLIRKSVVSFSKNLISGALYEMLLPLSLFITEPYFNHSIHSALYTV